MIDDAFRRVLTIGDTLRNKGKFGTPSESLERLTAAMVGVQEGVTGAGPKEAEVVELAALPGVGDAELGAGGGVDELEDGAIGRVTAAGVGVVGVVVELQGPVEDVIVDVDVARI